MVRRAANTKHSDLPPRHSDCPPAGRVWFLPERMGRGALMLFVVRVMGRSAVATFRSKVIFSS